MTNQHLTSELLQRFHKSLMTEKETKEFMEHIGECNACAEILADSFTEDYLFKAPKDLKKNIIAASHKTPIYLAGKASREVHRTSKQFKLFLYSLKVGAAVVTALFLLFSGIFNFSDPIFKNTPSFTEDSEILISQESPSLLKKIGIGTNNISSTMKNFSNQLINKEDLNDD